MAGSLVTNIQPAISEFFLQPIGLLGLLALIPLIVFYLIRRKPEQQIMPAMMFFMKDRKSGKAHTALRKLMRNLLLLFHIILVLGFAAALAHPFFEAPASADKTVVIFDKSASMDNDVKEARNFVESNLGEENTLIIVDNDLAVKGEGVSNRQVMREIRSTETDDVETDIASALELASDYSGAVIVASDLDQTVSQKSSEDAIKNLRNNDRTVKVMDIAEENSWGIINVEPGKENSSIDVKNFMDKDASIQLRKDQSARKISIEAGSVKTVTVETEKGRNTLKLEEDSFKPDNTAYISIPEQKNYKVAFITEGNPYFEKAVELISFTDIEVMEPPVQKEINADVYVIGNTDRVLTETVNRIEGDVKKGKSLIVFGHPGVFNLGLNSLPANKNGGYQNTTLNIRKPVKINLGPTQVINAKKNSGESYASPDHALIRSDYGDGEVFFYNIKDTEFRTNFLYPVFWKKVLQELVDQPSVNELNLETGDTIEAEQVKTPEGETLTGEVKLRKTGYYEVGSRTYAANLESEDESYSEQTNNLSENLMQELEKRNVQSLAALLLALLVLGELGYLRHIGEL